MKLKMVSLIKAGVFFVAIILGVVLINFAFTAGLVCLIAGIVGLVLQVYNIVIILTYDPTVFNKTLKEFYKGRWANLKACLASLFNSKKEL